MPDARTCPRCGTTIPADAPENLCPRCLLDGLTDGSTLSRTGESPESSGLHIGQHLGRYRLVRRLGRGGFGEVWEAESHETGRHTALKLLPEARHASGEALERFAREGRLAASLSHPRCVFVFGADTVDGYPAIDMELMDGGTLQDVLGREGPLPYPRAVDAVLDMIDGLEAAHAAGILHRDVKPSNAFVDAEGRVKIGDFGLSKSLEDQELLSSAGGFIGTPSYASPEQVRGGDLDVRSDIYSVGATLYALLAGHAPFRGRRATEVLAKILADDPPALPATVPRSLARIVRRTLAKSAEARYPAYAALRAALLPFSSRGLSAAGLARRVLAKLVDDVLIMVPAVLVLGLPAMSSNPFALYIGGASLVYFSLTEGLWGRSLGKRLLGLRVVRRDDRPIGLGRALGRAAVYVAFQHVSRLPLYLGVAPLIDRRLLWLASYLVYATMRSRNGYSGVHDLVTGTWVRSIVPGRKLPPAFAGGIAHAVEPGRDRRFGPYIESHPLTEGVLVAWDPVLRRNVWIHHFEPGHRGPTLSALAVAAPHRLRWLQGSRQSDRHWDAYEALRGMSLAEWIRARGTLPWAELRDVVQQAAEGIERSLAQRDPASVLSAARVWIDASGTVKLLDFPAGAEDGGTFSLTQWRAFVHQLVHFALNGRLEPVPLDRIPPVPLPAAVRPVLARLCGEAPPFDSPAEVAAAMQDLAARPAAVSRARRLASLVPPALLPAQMLLIALLMGHFSASPEFRAATEARAYLERMPHEPTAERREACRVLMGSYWAKVPASSRWKDAVPAYHPKRGLLDEAERQYGAASEAQLHEARDTIHVRQSPPLSRLDDRRFITTAAAPLALFAVLALPMAVLLRGGLLFSLCGIAVQAADGEPASRARCLLRALCAWAPLWPMVVDWRGLARLNTVPIPALILLAMVAGAAYALWRPERGLPDLLAGTRLVPR